MNKKAFIGFLTAGDPTLEKTEEFILEMEKAGADVIEIGIPFSDPVAEGEVIETANLRALSKHTNITAIFEMVKSVRQKTKIPLIFLTYCNPVFRYGYEEFFEKCKEVGINGIIFPDVPYEESSEIRKIADENEVALISLIAPTSKERIAQITKEAKGFVYIVSSMGVTGVRNEIAPEVKEMVELVKAHTNIPVAVGFGITSKKQVKEISRYADGIIVGSAIVKIIEEHGEKAGSFLHTYVKEMKEAMLF